MLFFPNLPYDPIRDFEPLTLDRHACMALVTAPNVPVNTPKELVEWAKKQDGGVSYASAAPGSSPARRRRAHGPARRHEGDAHPLPGQLRRDA